MATTEEVEKKVGKEPAKKSWIAEHPVAFIILVIVVVAMLYYILMYPVPQNSAVMSIRNNIQWYLVGAIGVFVVWKLEKLRQERKEYVSEEVIRERFQNHVWGQTRGKYIIPFEEIMIREHPPNSGKFLVWQLGNKFVREFDVKYAGSGLFGVGESSGFKSTIFDNPDAFVRQRERYDVERLGHIYGMRDNPGGGMNV